MAIPQGRLASEVNEVTLGEYHEPEGPASHPITCKERGPIAIEDTTQGLRYQNWTLTWVPATEMFWVTPETTGDPVQLYSAPDIKYASFTFDQAGRISFTYTNSVSSFMYWYDTQVAHTVITDLGADIATPSIYLDDKRSTQSIANDMLLWYTKDEGAGTFELFMLRQRDRFQTEYSMATNLPTYHIAALGMTDKHRVQLQIGLGVTGEVTPELPAPPPPATANIIWAGSEIHETVEGTGDQECKLTILEHDGNGPWGNCNAKFGKLGDESYTSWLDQQPANFTDYWIRVRTLGTIENLTIKDFDNVEHNLNDEFYAPGATLTVDTIGAAAPVTKESSVYVDICKDNAGSPDGNWHTRAVRLTAVEQTVYVPPPDPPGDTTDITGAVSWSSVFGSNFEDMVSGQFYKVNQPIPSGGLAIWFDVENTASVKQCKFNTIVTTWTKTRRLIQVGTVVKDFTTPPTAVNATGGSAIDCGINTSAYDYEFTPGGRYIWNIKLLDVSSGYTTLQVYKQ